jgi:hypothetical protein
LITMLRALSLALKFLIELAAFATFAYWGTRVGSGAVSVAPAIAAPAMAIVLWTRLAAPALEASARAHGADRVRADRLIALSLAGAPARLPRRNRVDAGPSASSCCFG